MKINLIAEIGLNHFGKYDLLKKYVKSLNQKEIDGVSIQIPKRSLMSKDHKKYLLSEVDIKKFIHLAKKNFNLVGITTSDQKKIKFLSKCNIDFFKVTSLNISNIELIKEMQRSSTKKIYLSTGMFSKLKIQKILKKLKKKKLNLIHTTFTNNISELNLRKILILKNFFKLPISYGNHCKSYKTLVNSVFYEPDSIFFYIKFDKKLNYPDDQHAIKIDDINFVIKKIKENIKISGLIND